MSSRLRSRLLIVAAAIVLLGVALALAAGEVLSQPARFDMPNAPAGLVVEPKELWPVTNAAHVDLHAFDRAAYEARVLGFFAEHLRKSTP